MDNVKQYIRDMIDETKRKDAKTILLTFVSIIFLGIALSVLTIMDYGMDPFTYMNVNIANRLGWSLGNWQLVFNIFLFIPVILWGKKQIGIGTIFNMVMVGYTVDFCCWIWNLIGLGAHLSRPVIGIPVMLAMVFLFIFSAATYMSTGLGASPVDAPPLILWQRFPKIPFRVIRFAWDATAVVIGYLLCGEMGIVTILMLLFLGTAVEMVSKILR